MPLSPEQLQRLLSRHPTLSVQPSGTLINTHFGRNVTIGDNSSIHWSLLEDHVTIGRGSSVAGVRIGANSTIGDDCTIGDPAQWATPPHGIETIIGRNVTIGPRSIIESGARIPDNDTIAPGARIDRPAQASAPTPPSLYSEILEHLPLVQVHKLWVADRGDDTLRLAYDLAPTDIVIDAGGYKGDWAEQIADRYHPRLHVFEPIALFAQAIQQRLGTGAHVHAVGLAGVSREEAISLEAEGSSIIKDAPAARHERIRLVAAADIFQQIILRGSDIALLKINIEGCEYELLEHLLDTLWIKRIRHLQIQFHDFVLNARERRRAIQERLHQTHAQRWNYPFIWEAWERVSPSRA